MVEWVWITWHLKGAGLDLDTWLSYSNRRRLIIRREVQKRIELHNSVFENE